MRSFNANKTASFTARHRVLIPAIAVLLVAGVGFAAAGGIQLVRGWFVTTSVNGQVVDAQEVVPDEDGNASFTIPVPEIDGDMAVIDMTVEGDQAGSGGSQTVTISLDGETPGQADVTITSEPASEEPEGE